MHIVVVEDDEGLRGVLRTWMKETESTVTGCSEIKTYENIDIIIVGPNASLVDIEAIETRHIPYFRIGFGQNMDDVLSWVLEMQEEIRARANQSIVEDRPV